MASLSTRFSTHAASARAAFPSQTSMRISSSTGSSFVSMRTFQTSELSLVNFRRLRISCEAGSSPPAAKPETLQKVIEIVTKQLAAPEGSVLPHSKFQALGADSLDQVEIVMALEEEFNISVDEDGAESIVTVQDAANLIEKVNTKV